MNLIYKTTRSNPWTEKSDPVKARKGYQDKVLNKNLFKVIYIRQCCYSQGKSVRKGSFSH